MLYDDTGRRRRGIRSVPLRRTNTMPVKLPYDLMVLERNHVSEISLSDGAGKKKERSTHVMMVLEKKK